MLRPTPWPAALARNTPIPPNKPDSSGGTVAWLAPSMPTAIGPMKRFHVGRVFSNHVRGVQAVAGPELAGKTVASSSHNSASRIASVTAAASWGRTFPLSSSCLPIDDAASTAAFSAACARCSGDGAAPPPPPAPPKGKAPSPSAPKLNTWKPPSDCLNISPSCFMSSSGVPEKSKFPKPKLGGVLGFSPPPWPPWPPWLPLLAPLVLSSLLSSLGSSPPRFPKPNQLLIAPRYR